MNPDLPFDLLFELTGDAVFVTDAGSGRVLEANEQASGLTGRTRENLKGTELNELVFASDPMGGNGPLAYGEKGRGEVVVNGPGSAPLPCEATWCRVMRSGGPVYVWVLRDLFSLRRANDQIALKDTAMACVASGVTISDARDPEHPLIYVNRGFEEITGFSAGEVLGRNCRFLQGGDRDQEDLNRLRRALALGQACQVRLRNYRKDGGLFWNELHISPVRNERGDLTHFVGIQIDVTERVRAREQLERSEQIKTRFIRMVSHEFRTPMTGIRASAAFLKEYGDAVSPEKRRRHFLNIERALERMNRLLDDVLFSSRSEVGKVPFEPAAVDLKVFCEELVDELHTVHGNQRVVFEPTFPRESTFLVDAALLNQIIYNLLSNAVKYSPESEAVRFQAGVDDGRIVLVVEDSGIGIPGEEQDSLFEPFHRGSNVGAIKGTGLGLYIVKRSAEIHGGAIRFSSAVGLGSRFKVVIPAEVPQSGQHEQDPCH